MDFDKLYSQLNTEQRSAVDQIEGPVQVIAGPGTGKTQILAMRVANILRKTQVNPNNILALTFTESGVLAMRKRLKQIIGKAAYYVNIYTFHSFCARVISEFPEKFVTTRDLKPIDDLGKYVIIRDIIDNGDYKYLSTVGNPYFYLYSIVSSISDLKREYIKPDDFAEIIDAEVKLLDDEGLDEDTYKYKQQSKNIYKWQELNSIYEKYQSQLHSRGYYDFEDMILFAVEALKSDEELLYYYQEMFQYFLVDEFQDTNSAQNELVNTLASFHDSPNLFVVGDDDQSIFRFQGASLENILLFKKKYPDCTSVVLKENYRSSQLILDAANSLIVNNAQRVETDKHLSANAGYDNLPVEKYEFKNCEQENYFLVKKIEALVEQGVSLEEIAIIMRDNKDRDDVIDFFVKAGIPYHVYGGGNILDDVWIKKIVSLLKVVNDPMDDLSIFDVLTLDCFAIPQEDIFKLAKIASMKKKSYIGVVNDSKLIKFFTNDGQKALVEFFNLLMHLQRSQSSLSFKSFFEVLLTETGYLEYILSRPDYVEVLNKVNSFFDFVKGQAESRTLTLDSFMQRLEVMKEHRIGIQEKEWLSSAKAVQILTGHKAKGLEFEYVFMPKCYNGKWGNKRNISFLTLPDELLKASTTDSKDDNEDERRLFYTALTRAKKQLFLSYAETYQNSSGKIFSQFVEEIEADYVLDEQFDTDDLVGIAKLQFKEPDELYFDENASEYIRQVVASGFRMSPTALSTYQLCKRKFLYESILRIPRKTSSALYLGSAIHKALEKLFIYFKDNDVVPPLSWVNSVFEKDLQRSDVSESEIEFVKETGFELLKGWYEYYKDSFKKPLNVEFYFGNKDIRLDDVPLTGKVDKMTVVDSKSKTLKVIDYKSGSPKSRNDLMGLTKTSDGRIYQQLYFYKLLCDLDPTLQYLAVEGEVDFIKPNPRGKYKKEVFQFEEEELAKLKDLIKATYDQMLSLDFSKTDDLYECSKCEFRDVCKR
jgi:DNA helicase-2/ATP-dependent DNA helicase PcrA